MFFVKGGGGGGDDDTPAPFHRFNSFTDAKRHTVDGQPVVHFSEYLFGLNHLRDSELIVSKN